MTVGLALIARDEADQLPGLLDSVRGAFDQVVLCDTGSTDGTVEVFERWARAQDWPHRGFAPWKVGHFAWRDDFAAARNHADSLLDTEWSSWADCDDVVRGAGSLRGLARSAAPGVGAFVAGYDYARMAGGPTIAYVRRERLVRRAMSRGWVRRVHECQEFDGEAVGVGPEVCEWLHRKWAVPPGEALPASERNLRILRAWVADEPDHPYALSCLAQELCQRGRHREAVRWFQRFLEVDEPGAWPEYRARMLRRMATSYLLLGRRRAALRAGRAALDLVADWPETYLTLAEAHLALHRWRRAERWAREALRLGAPDTALTVNPLDYTFAPRVVLAGALAGRRRFGEAVAVGEEAREIFPGHPELDAQLRAWRRRQLSARPRALRAAEVAAAGAMVAALLGTPSGAGAAPTGDHNELGAVTFNGIPILAPSTTGLNRPIHITALGGGHQLRGSQYVPFVAGFTSNDRLIFNNVIGGFGRQNSDVTAIFPFDSTNLLGIDQTNTGRIGAFTQFGQTDPQCNSALGAQRPLSFDRGYLNPFLAVGAVPPTDTGFFLDLFNPSTCRVIASTFGTFDPNRATDVKKFLFGSNGVLVTGGVGTGASEDPGWKLIGSVEIKTPWIAGGGPLAPSIPLVEFPFPGSFTDGITIQGGQEFDLVGYDPARAVFFGACAGPAGQPDPRCGPNGTRTLLDLNPSTFQVFFPQIATGPGGTIVGLPYQNLQDGTAHTTFLRVDPDTLGVQAQRDVVFPGTIHIPGIAVDPRGNASFGFTIRNPLDPTNPLDDNRIGLGILNPDLSLNRLTINQSAPTPPTFAPGPRVDLLPFLERLFVAETFPGGGRAQAQAAAVNLRRIVRVQFAAVRVSGRGASLRCAWLTDRRAHFVADTPIRGSCQGARWITAAKGRGNTWTLRLTRGLPRGQYVGYARATNAAGVTVRHFGAANRRAFRVR